MDLLQRLREAQADTKREMKRTDIRTKDVLILSDLDDVFGECADEIERLREQLSNMQSIIASVERERDDFHNAFRDSQQDNVTLSEQLAAMTKERDELAKDAERYRWLRENLKQRYTGRHVLKMNAIRPTYIVGHLENYSEFEVETMSLREVEIYGIAYLGEKDSLSLDAAIDEAMK